MLYSVALTGILGAGLGSYTSGSPSLLGRESAGAAIHVRNELQRGRLVLVLHPPLSRVLRASTEYRDYPFPPSHPLSFCTRFACVNSPHYCCSVFLTFPSMGCLFSSQARQRTQRVSKIDREPQWAIERIELILKMLGDRAKNSILSAFYFFALRSLAFRGVSDACLCLIFLILRYRRISGFRALGA